ncbi:alpha-2-macroglobulin family protein [Novipirellula artificiosorum]|uniref:alpha-2-macroglobulin family protein n=1 Tax=Novipirellula artificiosorum TaxID=2528016 RepID=UPI001E2F4AC2|nr:alpha-2-macroglobulin family protein [Novipirellula artificiosorum]
MSTRKFCLASILVLLLGPWLIAEDPGNGSEESSWTAVQEAISNGLPKTAIEELEPIIRNAKDHKKYAEAVKAIAMKIALEGTIQGNRPEEKIVRLEAEIEEAPQPMQPIMQAILADWYWHYFQQNRWRFMQRTQTAAAVSDDINTWDLSRILAEVSGHFDKALENGERLQSTPIARYDDLLEKGNVPDRYRPTLWDFIVYEALEFYQSAEQAGAKSQDAFDLSADSPIFARVEAFVSWKPDSGDTESATLKAIGLYQQLLAFHSADDDRSAYLDADLSRLVFGKNQAFGEETQARFKAAAKRFADKHAEHEVSARALHEIALVVHGENDFVEARRIAAEGLARFPESIGGRHCFNLIQQIEAPSASVLTERVWNDPWPTIDVRYQNVDKIYFRLVRFDFEAFIRSDRWRTHPSDPKTMLTSTPVKSWSVDLPKTEDYQAAVEELPVPQDVEPGSYFLISSHREDFAEADNSVSFTEVWVSSLALVLRNEHGSGELEGFVLDAKTGEPIVNANVRSWTMQNRSKTLLRTVQTDANGLFRIRGEPLNGLLLHVSANGQGLSAAETPSIYLQPDRQKTTLSTQFFTDRALYRPGQTIRYKGICLSVNSQSNRYETLESQNVVVVFADANNKEIERVVHRTNDYGSFSGSVTAPRDRLMGRMSLRVEGEPSGQTSIRVEEYKRPKFQVEIDSPKQGAKLGQIVKLQGKATAYTGAAIDDAQVTYRVVREVRYPIWWSFWMQRMWMPDRTGGSQEIAHCSTRTDAQGVFSIEFPANPDLSIPEKNDPTFQYTVYADVTDSSGETRSDQHIVHAGYVSLSAVMSADDWLHSDAPVEISITTKTLDGEGQSAVGIVSIYSLKQPLEVIRKSIGQDWYRARISDDEASEDPSGWELGDRVLEQPFETDGAGNAKLSVEMEPGIYRAKLVTRDRDGKEVTALLPIQVVDVEADRFNTKVPELFRVQEDSLEPGETMRAVWGSGYDSARTFVEIEHRGKLLQSYWTDPGKTQVMIEQPVEESMRGGFTVRTTMVRENRAYLNTQAIDVPWSNKHLKVEWEHFTSKLDPAAKETWTAIVSGPDAGETVAEMVATLYDASLDAFQIHRWQQHFSGFYRDHSRMGSSFQNSQQSLHPFFGRWNVERRDVAWVYRHYPSQIKDNLLGYQFRGRAMMRGGGMGGMEGMAFGAAAPAMDGAMEDVAMEEAEALPAAVFAMHPSVKAQVESVGGSRPPDVDLDNVSARKNLKETAFFYPHLIACDDGKVRMEFTMPEALTQWKFLGFAHDRKMRSGLLEGSTVTAKDLMVQPNPPRFVREGDLIEFTVKVVNQSATAQTGQVRLSFAAAKSGDAVNEELGNTQIDQSFDLSSGQSQTLSWEINVPEEIGFLTYKAVGSTGKLSDGEEGYLPVLSQRILVTESLPLPIRGKQVKEFEFEKLIQSADSDTLRHESLTLQVASNPSWYAVMALPYLMEYPHQCSEQTFNRLYANALAQHIANSDPKIERVFEQWRGTPALDSPLEKNEELKSVMLEETPWVREADSESQARRNVGILFDPNRLAEETNRAQLKLTEMQQDDGAWPWFPGGRGNDYITLYITTGFGRMRHLGVEIDTAAAVRSLARLDAWVTERYANIKPQDRDQNHLSTTIAMYLYGRSFFLQDQAIAAEHREAVDYWVDQARRHGLKLSYRQSQAHLAIALKRFGDLSSAQAIMRSIKERSVSNDEMGMYWRENELSWWWYRAPIETQAMMIEAFDEVMDDREAVEDCKVWLLKQKQTRDWKTTKATADAVYSLLLRGSDLLASDELVEVDLGGKTIEPESVEAGTGFYQRRLTKSEIEPEMGNITMRKMDDGVAWGSLHWQYMEDIAKVTPHEGTPLKLEKALFVKKNTADGPTLVAVEAPVHVGDELVVRVVLRTDRDMEYVHMKDYRGSGTEPVNVLSRYKFQDGLGYYESTRDTATHFFIDYLPKGTYVFEYSTRVQLRGEYQTGLAMIECMYAPEFNSHSESLPIVVQ